LNKEKKEITVKIKRQKNKNPETSYWTAYDLMATPDDRVLDLLEKIRHTRDDTLAFRSNCGHGICGSDAMNINGNNRLACRTLLADLGFPDRVIIQPLGGFTVKKDLVIREAELEDIAGELELNFSPADNRKKEPAEENYNNLNEAINCIECGSCQSACPVTWEEKRFPGPQLLTRAGRYIFDDRDSRTQKRLHQLDSYCSLWNCQTIYNCVEACPREINITALLSELKNKILKPD